MLVVAVGLEAFAPASPSPRPPVDERPQTDGSNTASADDPITPAQSATVEDEELVDPAVLQRLVAVRTAHPRAMGPEVECMAKVIYHEAANQALRGQLAVAQVIQNRTHSGPTFPHSICGVVNQRGQFFRTRAFKIPRSDVARWRVAVAMAFVAQEHRLGQVAPGALFYHATYVRPAWRRQHQQIAQIGDQIFYR